MSLVLWIAIHVKHIDALLAYVDDNFSHDVNPILSYYAPYSSFYPSKQVRLLQLWDEIALPHEQKKQEYGRSLVIIGFHIDTVTMTVTLPDEKRDETIAAVRTFALDAPRRRRPLIEWQRNTGWMNWALNVAPLLRPALQSSYHKMAGRSIRNAPIFINRRVTLDLLWFADTLANWNGIHMLSAHNWDSSAADLVLFCDAALSGGLAYWSPRFCSAFVADKPTPPLSADHIFWFEALTVVSALHWAAELRPPPSRLAIFTDSLNTIQLFDSLAALPAFHDLLLHACRLCLMHHIDLRVFHISGSHNVVADALSQRLFHVAQHYVPQLDMHVFTPPRVMLGALPC